MSGHLAAFALCQRRRMTYRARLVPAGSRGEVEGHRGWVEGEEKNVAAMSLLLALTYEARYRSIIYTLFGDR